MAATADSTTPTSSLPIHSRSNPIDLTLDDDDDTYITPRSKRASTDTLDSTDECSPSSSYSSTLASQYHPNPYLGPSLPPLSSERQVIDLTGSPSPPPPAAQNVPPGLAPINPDDPPKTPICIGQLTAQALILCHIPYLISCDPAKEVEWATVKLHYDHNLDKIGGNQDMIHILAPNVRAPNGDIIPGVNFGVVEQRVSANLGGMLGKGLIRLEAKILRGQPNLPALPIQLLVYTPKGNITVVGNYLRQCNMLLDHPTPPYDDFRVAVCPYFNPHNPPLR